MLAIWALVPLLFINPAWTHGSSQFTSYWSMAWKILHYLVSIWNKCNCEVVWTFFCIAFLWDWNENWHFQSCGHFWVFQICLHIEWNTFTASSFSIWNSSARIPLPLLALFVVMLSKAHLPSHSRMSGSRWVIAIMIIQVVKIFFVQFFCVLATSS